MRGRGSHCKRVGTWMQHAWPWDISIAPTRYEVSQTSKQTMYLDVRLFLCSQQQLTHSSKKKARSSGLVPTPFAHGQPFLPSSPADYMWGAFIVGTPHVIWHYLAEIADVYARSRVFTQTSTPQSMYVLYQKPINIPTRASAV